MKDYNHSAIEKKWQKNGRKRKFFRPKTCLRGQVISPNRSITAWWSFRIRPAPVCILGIRVHTPGWTLFPANAEWKDLMFCIRWVGTLLVCRRKIMPLKPGNNPRVVTKKNTDTFRKTIKIDRLFF